ncbi:putative 5'-nucleotidase-like [Apostichopus japonicus]|uniref:5'-nucleotidase n=1 Tax=Stichopus japonicus TaxID=307972 RepID=A0A2G8L9P4_STIJA|nr:putative 5'-nucleotidase-like [Apostichopus japonicus]
MMVALGHRGAVFLLIAICVSIGSTLEITFVHTNDIHTRFEETDGSGGECTDQVAQCFGGIARRATAIKNSRENDPNVILIDAGDQFQGPTLWFYVYKGLATAHFMDLLQYDAMALGNHEFDNGVEDVIRFLHNVSFPVISSNIDSSNEPEMTNLYTSSHVRIVEGQQVAFVGYTTVTTVDFAKPGEAPATHTPYGEYPLVIRPDDDPSRTVLVVQAYAYGIYLGHLSVSFDNNGEVESYNGNPILLDSRIEKDPEMFAEMLRWNEQVQAVALSVIGKSVVELDGNFYSCGIGECNLGNVLADAMVFSYIDESVDHEGWTTVSLAINTAGSIQSSLEKGEIRIGEINQILPYGNTIDIVTLEGRHLIEILETAVANVIESVPSGSFPQVSGMKIEYDLLRAPMERVIGVQVLCSECTVPIYEPIMEDVEYRVAMNSYMAGGGGGFKLVKEYTLSKESGLLDLDVTISYISANSPVRTGIENRIVVYDSQRRPISNKGISLTSYKTWIGLKIIVVFLLCVMIW